MRNFWCAESWGWGSDAADDVGGGFDEVGLNLGSPLVFCMSFFAGLEEFF